MRDLRKIYETFDLSRFEEWMVRSNLARIDGGEVGPDEAVETLRGNGYLRVAAAVEAAVSDEPDFDDEPPFGSFPEEQGTDLTGTPYKQVVEELRAREGQFFAQVDALKPGDFCTCQMLSKRVQDCPLHGHMFPV